MEGLCWRGWEKDISQCLNRNYKRLQFRHCRGSEGGKEGGGYVGQLVWGKYLEEPQRVNDLAGLFFGDKAIGCQPQSI